MIEGVNIISLKQIVDERGKIMHMLKESDEHFERFGEIYFSCCWPGIVKGWHTHSRMTVNNAVIVGHAKLVLYDGRMDSVTNGEVMELFIGEDNYCLVQIPPGITNGYKAYGDKLVIMANCATEAHDPHEISYLDPVNNNIPYDWSIKER